MTFGGWTALWSLLIAFNFAFSEAFGKNAPDELKERIRSSVTRATGKDLNWSEAFIRLFDRIYRPAVNWGFYGRSALSSIIVVTVLIIVGLARGGLSDLPSLETKRLLGLLYVGLVVNVVADVLSLAQTRLLLGWLSNRQTMITTIAALALDVMMTVLIMFLVFSVTLYDLESYVDPLPDWTPEIFRVFIEWVRGYWGFHNAPVTDASFPALLQQGISAGSPDYPLPVFLYSTFFTTVWIWLFSFSWLLSISLNRLGSLGTMALGWFGFDKNPIRAMGLVNGLALLCVYLAGSLVIVV